MNSKRLAEKDERIVTFFRERMTRTGCEGRDEITIGVG